MQNSGVKAGNHSTSDICLKKVPENLYDTEEYYIGLSYNIAFDVLFDANNIGRIYVSDYEESKFIEWAEIYPRYSGKGFYRHVLLKLMDALDIDFLAMETSKTYLAMYKHLGAEFGQYDEDREMTALIIRREALSYKI